MNYYDIWCNLKDSRHDVQFAENLAAFLQPMREAGMIEGWTLSRRKLGFGPAELGEFHIRIACTDLAQLDRAFGEAAARSGETEQRHAKVFAMVTHFRSALYRDFPDPQRVADR